MENSITCNGFFIETFPLSCLSFKNLLDHKSQSHTIQPGNSEKQILLVFYRAGLIDLQETIKTIICPVLSIQIFT